MTSNLTPQIQLPQRLEDVLSQNKEWHGRVLKTLARFAPWFEDNRLTFFPGYTNHGIRHVNQVMNTAAALMIDAAWSVITPGDAAAIAMAAVLHDCAMHLSEDGFLSLISREDADLIDGDIPWPKLWRTFVAEASRFDGRTLKRLFGEATVPLPVPLQRGAMNEGHHLLVGEFLRRHHARLAHEIARWGVPGPTEQRLSVDFEDWRVRDLFGLIARSHNLGMREATERLPPMHRRDTMGIHAPYVMALLRIADYVQIERDRAPGEIALVRSFASPISRGEWRAHSSVSGISMSAPDRETLVIEAYPDDTATYAKLRDLFGSMQRELDDTWAVLGEIYGAALSAFGLVIRRIRSTFDDEAGFARSVQYVPVIAAFDVEGADTLRLLIRPLYGDHPEIGVRELVQNAVDAVRERADSDETFPRHSATPDVRVDVETREDGSAIVTVSDVGVGMTADTIVNYFLKAGATFRDCDRWRATHTDSSGSSRVARSGRFGVGILAAFLLGDRVEVITRHYSEEEGISFSASIDDEVVELRKTKCSVGTVVKVVVDDPSVARRVFSQPALWDWYCVDWPSVERSINGQIIPQSHCWQGESAVLANAFRRLETPQFSDVQWTVWRDFNARRPLIICNGIRINTVTSAYTSVQPLFHRGVPYELAVEMPNLSVFDREGRFPLTLQRTDMAQSILPFHNDLRDEVIRDFIAFAVVNLPGQTLVRDWLDLQYPGLTTERSRDDVRWFQFWRASNGWALSDVWAFTEEQPRRIFVVTPGITQAQYSTFPETVAMTQLATGNLTKLIDFCFGRLRGGGPVRTLRQIGGRVAIPVFWRGSSSTDSFVNISDGTLFGKWGRVEGSDEEFVERILSWEEAPSELVADMFFEYDPSVAALLSRVAAVWKEIVGKSWIPFSLEDRLELREHPAIREYVRSYDVKLRDSARR